MTVHYYGASDEGRTGCESRGMPLTCADTSFFIRDTFLPGLSTSRLPVVIEIDGI